MFHDFLNSKIKDITKEEVAKYLGDDWDLYITEIKVPYTPSNKDKKLLDSSIGKPWGIYIIETEYYLCNEGDCIMKDSIPDDSETQVKDLIPEGCLEYLYEEFKDELDPKK